MPSSSSQPDPYDDSSPATHPVNVSYLVIGLLFVSIAAMWALRAGGAIDTDQLGLLLPLMLVAAGAIGLVAFTARGMSRSRRAAPPADEPIIDLGHDPYDDTSVLATDRADHGAIDGDTTVLPTDGDDGVTR